MAVARKTAVAGIIITLLLLRKFLTDRYPPSIKMAALKLCTKHCNDILTYICAKQADLQQIQQTAVYHQTLMTVLSQTQAVDCFTARDASSPAHASSSPLGGSTRRLRVRTF